jgi:hypothetical protein
MIVNPLNRNFYRTSLIIICRAACHVRACDAAD